MRQLTLTEMSQVSGGAKLWKCILGLALIAGGVAGALTGVGAIASGAAIGGGATIVNSSC